MDEESRLSDGFIKNFIEIIRILPYIPCTFLTQPCSIFMRRVVAKLLFVMGLLAVGHPVFAAGQGMAQVLSMRSYVNADHTRVVFDLTGPAEHILFTLKSPERVVIDLSRARVHGRFKSDASGRLIQRVRFAPRKQKDLRFVLDLNDSARPKSFMLEPSGEHGHRLVVDLHPQSKARSKANRPASLRALKIQEREKERPPRKVVIAVDAGHGGADPGALGPSGLREKVVTLQVARRLVAAINREPGMRAVLTRNGDYYLKLRTRIDRARKAKADLFVSIHADAFRDPRARGSSVYILSRRGASSEAARWLASKENAADHIGGVKLNGKDEQLAQVLLDLSQNGAIEASDTAAAEILRQLKRVGSVHKHQVERASFVVLKSPDIPSILVETAFISNPKEERKLRSARHQNALAQAMLRGIKHYFRDHAPPDTWFAAKRRTLARSSDKPTDG